MCQPNFHTKIVILTISNKLKIDNRGYFAVLSLRRDNFLAVSSVNIHDIYLNIQLRTLYIDMNIVKIYAGSDM